MRKAPVAPLIIGIAGVAVLLVLGFWQVQRLSWKEAMIAEIETRLTADPVAVPEKPDPQEHRLLRVRTRGRLGQEEIHLISSVKLLGPGYRVVVPMELGDWDSSDGRTVLVDLGFIPERLKDPVTRREASVRWTERFFQDEVVGLLHWPNERDSFTPEPDIRRNIWFARDVAQMAEWLKTDPVLIVAESHPDGDWPRPRPPGVGVPNRHLEYALTWFGLAAVWTVMSLLWFRAERRKMQRRKGTP